MKKQKNGNAFTALVLMSLMIAVNQGCLSSQANKNAHPFNQEGKVIGKTDTSILVKTNDTTFRIHPVDTKSISKGDSAKFYKGNNLPDGTNAVVDTLSIVKKQKLKK